MVLLVVEFVRIEGINGVVHGRNDDHVMVQTLYMRLRDVQRLSVNVAVHR